ncbi:MAG: tetratricopeptide repeat protein [Candidatus Atabeyarchaeum deiterrae]
MDPVEKARPHEGRSPKGGGEGKGGDEDYAAVIEKYEAEIRSGNTDVVTLINLGNAYSGKGEHDEALKCYDKALLMSPDKKQEILILNGLADAYSKAANFEKEVETYTALQQKSPEDRSIVGKAARAYEKSGRIQDANLYYAKALGLTPNDPNLLYSYSFFCEKLGQPNNAIIALEKALRLKPDSEPILQKLSIMYTTIGEHEKAIKTKAKLLELDQDDVGRWEDLALSHAVARKYKEAIETCRKAVVRFNTSSTWILTGDIFADQKKESNALYCYDVAAGLGHPEGKAKAANLRNKGVKPKDIGLQQSVLEKA